MTDATTDAAERGGPPPSRAQIRGARGMLDWSLLDLARAARVSVSTVRRLESSGPPLPSEAASALVRSALEAAGIRFRTGGRGGEGVWLDER